MFRQRELLLDVGTPAPGGYGSHRAQPGSDVRHHRQGRLRGAGRAREARSAAAVVTSLAMRAHVARLRLTRTPLALYEHPERLLAAAARAVPAPPPASLLRRAEVSTRWVEGQEVTVVAARGGGRRRPTVVWVHGGGFLFPPDTGHWSLLGALVADTGATVLMPRYRLAPHGTHGQAIALLRAVVDALVEPGHPWLLAGDSAGGGIAHRLAASLRDTPGPAQPAAVVLLSPWLDLQLEAWRAAADRHRVHDPVLAPAGLLAAGSLFAGSAAEVERLAWRPAAGGGLPPVEIHAGDRDLLVFGSRELRAAAAAGGWPVTLTEYAGAVHGFPVTRWAAEAHAVRTALARAVVRLTADD